MKGAFIGGGSLGGWAAGGKSTILSALPQLDMVN